MPARALPPNGIAAIGQTESKHSQSNPEDSITHSGYTVHTRTPPHFAIHSRGTHSQYVKPDVPLYSHAASDYYYRFQFRKQHNLHRHRKCVTPDACCRMSQHVKKNSNNHCPHDPLYIPRLHRPCAALLCAPECPTYEQCVNQIVPWHNGRCRHYDSNDSYPFQYYWGITHMKQVDRIREENEFRPQMSHGW